ncbi:MAG: MATE family efflux transporter [Eubacteriales bacterium]|nr:MATE family efflux transporter [Eubacteriales bacterium]
MLECLNKPRSFYRRLLYLSLPVIAQNLITTSLGFMDTFMVGLLGSDQMSAVTVANVPIFIIQLIVFGLQSGSSVLISQYWGKGDRESINRVIGIGFYVAGGISTLFALAMFFFPAGVLGLITDNAHLIALAEPYIQIVGFSYIFNALSSIYIGMQRSMENPKFGMTVFAVSTVCNTLGNYLLIFGKLGLPALGIRGAAVATLCSRILEFAISFLYALRCRTMPLQPRHILRPGTDVLRRFVKYSTPVLLNETLWGTGTSLFTVIMGHMALSEELIAAYTVAGGIDKLVTASLFGVAAASAVIVGKEIGTGASREQVLSTGRALTVVSLCLGVLVGLTETGLYLLVLQPCVLPLFKLSAVSAGICTLFIYAYSSAAPLNAFVTTVVVGVLRGGGDVRCAMLIDILPLWLGTLPLLALCGLVLDAPPILLCFVMAFEPLLKCPFGLWRLLRSEWIHDVTVQN